MADQELQEGKLANEDSLQLKHLLGLVRLIARGLRPVRGYPFLPSPRPPHALAVRSG